MAGPSDELLEIILRDCEAAGNQPWYPSDYAQSTGVDRTRLDRCLDELRLGGLLKLTEWVRGKGQGYALTEIGHEVVQRPRLLSQIRERGVPRTSVPALAPAREDAATSPEDWDRGKSLHQALTRSGRPIVTQILLALNIINFLAGGMLATRAGATWGDYLGWGSTKREVRVAQHETGALEGRASLIQGEWWRLFTYMFVHPGGLIHLVMNMWVLLSIGPLLEKVWGHFPYAILYLVSGVAGGLAAAYYSPQIGVGGASGAICGLLGSLLGWVWLNRQYLRNSGAMLSNLMMNVMLLVLISMVPNVSGSGHAGGGIAGLVLTIPLNFYRFGKGEQRWLGLIGSIVVVVVVAGAAWYISAPNELEHAQALYLEQIAEVEHIGINTANDVVDAYEKEVRQSGKVSPEKKEEMLAALEKANSSLAALHEKLENHRLYKDARINTALDAAAEYAEKWQKYFDVAKDYVNQQGPGVLGLNAIMRQLKELQNQLKDSVLNVDRTKQKG